MGVTFIAPQGTYTAPAKLVSKSITENGTYDPADDNANGYSSVTVNVEGGGGSSDFSTAEVTINGIPSADLMLANISQTFPVDTVTSMVTITEDTTIVTAVLYKGNSVLTVVGTMVATLSGNIQKMSDTVYLITGDCTITIS